MAEENRHEEILQCINTTLTAGTVDDYLGQEIRIEDYNKNQAPACGISISPIGDSEIGGTNLSDDIQYITLVTRTVSSLGEDDREEKSKFRVNIRRLFHNKRIQCGEGCYLYNRVKFGSFASPKAWQQNNNSTSSMQVLTTVRELRG